MKTLLLIAFLAACGGTEHTPVAARVPVPVLQPASEQLAETITMDSPAGIFLPAPEPYCSSTSDCAGFGTCSSSTCGHCSSSSDCKGGTCSSGHCSNSGA